MKRLPLIALFVANLALYAQGDTGAITGRVLGMDGRPASGVRVALASPDASGKISSDILAGLTLTDESGHYRIENIPPGRYGIVAGPVAAPTFYPGTASASAATVLTVLRGSITTIRDFALRTPTTQTPGSQTPDPAIRAQAIAEMNRQLKLPGQMISGKIIVDGPLVSTFLPNLKVGFMRVVGAFAGSPFPAFGGRSPIADVIYSTSINANIDGTFRLELKPMPYWLVIGRADSKPLAGFVVKSITLGTIDLLKEELKADRPVTGEIIITLQSVPISNPIKL